MRKWVLWSIVASISLVTGVFIMALYFFSPPVENISFSRKVSAAISKTFNPPAHLPTPEEKPISLIFGGDVMLSRNVNHQMVQRNDFAWPFRAVASRLSQSDLVVVNFEAPFLQTKDYTVLTGSFIFKIDPRAIVGLQLAHIGLLSLANNHSFNQGEQGLLDTFDLLEKNNISYVGAGRNFNEAHQGKVIAINGTRFGFLAYAYPDDASVASTTSVGIATMNIADAEQDIKRLKQQADIIIVQMHAGTEYVTKPTPQQTAFARAAIDAGADAVIGHHPHWVQWYENYLGKPIFYSLGNFVFDQMWSTETQQGILVQAEFKDKKLVTITVMPIRIKDYGQATFVEEEKEQNEILQKTGLKNPVIDF